jgi:UDP-N-acetylglucosamine diphosphorylase/glucosamine-1-phosphate N-acetyltransferase
MHNISPNTEKLQEKFLPLTYLTPFQEILFGTQTINQRYNHPNISFDFNLNSPWDLISQNAGAITKDEPIFTNNDNYLVNPHEYRKTGKYNLIIHKSALVEECFFNTEGGPIIIDQEAHIMAGSAIRGPVYIGVHSTIKMGATIYGGTSIGRECIIGGEVKNSIFQGFSNKGHHGYIGDSFIGTWCNLGAGTSCSNVKNTAGIINYWNIGQNEFLPGGTKCGVLMGDFCKTAINTSLNSGTILGIFAHLFDAQLLSPKYIPAFSWGCHTGKSYEAEKIIIEIKNWMAMKNHQPDPDYIHKILALYNQIKKA